MTNITYAIRDGSGNVTRTETLPEGKEPTLAPEVFDPIAGIFPGETADIIAIEVIGMDESSTADLEASLSKSAEAERSRILSQPGIGAALLSRAITPNSKLSSNDLSMVFEYVDTDLQKLIHSNQHFSNLHIQFFLYRQCAARLFARLCS